MNKTSHLSFIEQVVDRMGNNSFLLKNLDILITIAAVTIYYTISNLPKCILIVFAFLIIYFWCMDSYYLRQERLFRYLYSYIRNKREKDIDFNMKFDQLSFTLKDFSNISFFKVMISKTELLLYSLSLITVILLIVFK